MSDTDSARNGDLRAMLAEPFAADEVEFKPQSVKGNRAMAIAYIDARCVMDRLDRVLGVENWQDAYTHMPDGLVGCRLSVRINGEWVTKEDVGAPSEQPDGGDRGKAAVSDALKRTAVKFGVGRYLYSLPITWADYDPVKRQFVNPPRLPDWALPPKKPHASARPTQQPPQTEGAGDPHLIGLEEAARQGPSALAAQYRAMPNADRTRLAKQFTSLQPAAQDFVIKNADPFCQWLNTEPTLEAFNADLPKVREIKNPDVCEFVKKCCRDYAANCGWSYSRAKGVYVVGQSKEDAA